MKFLKNKQFVCKCLSTAMTVSMLGFSVLAVDGICSEFKCRNLKKQIYEKNKSAYVEFVNYEVSKLNSQYLDDEITFEECLSAINELSDEELCEDKIVEKFATEDEAKKIKHYDTKGVVTSIGMLALVGTSMGACFINDKMIYGEKDL